MLLITPLISLLIACSSVGALPITNKRQSDSKPVYFLLTGDSTTAKQKNGSGGWGDGFLKALKAPASGVNYGHNGRTTVDFRTGGDWNTVIQDLKSNKNAKDVYVTIQVGQEY
jgi:hypothetical protein